MTNKPPLKVDLDAMAKLRAEASNWAGTQTNDPQGIIPSQSEESVTPMYKPFSPTLLSKLEAAKNRHSGITFADPDEVFRESVAKLEAELSTWVSRAPQMTGVPARMREYTLATFPADTPYFKAVLRWVSEQLGRFPEVTGLLILGPAGVGKTGLATAAYSRLLAEFGSYYGTGNFESRGWWISQDELLDQIRSGVGVRSTDPQVRAQETGLLLVDDLVSSQSMTDWAYEMIFKIIDARYKNLKPLIATTNITALSDLDDLDRRLAGRLGEMCTVIEIPPDSRDLRQR